jgi:membrane protein implicated in regulation of membrane protease activity
MARWPLGVLAGANAALAVLLAIAINAATSVLPRVLTDAPLRAWLLVAVFAVGSVGCAVLLVRTGRSDSTTGDTGRGSGQGRVGGVHVGGNLKVAGSGNVITGGDHVSIATPSDQPPSAPPPRRQRRG